MSEEGLAAAPVSLQELQGHHLKPGAWQTPHSQQVPVHNMKQELTPHHLQPGAWQAPHSQQVLVYSMKQELQAHHHSWVHRS